MNKYIQNLIAQGENLQLDFKFEISDTRKIARTFSAFANTKGGKLLVGVKDNGHIAGIRTDEEAYMVESAAHLQCKPRIEYSIKPWFIDGKTILEVTIPESKEKPHLAPWKENMWRAFVRVSDENYVASGIQVYIWKQKANPQGIFIKYKEQEKALLHYLGNNPEISLNAFCKLCKIKYPIAKKILVNLITIGVLEIVTFENKTTFRLNKDI